MAKSLSYLQVLPTNATKVKSLCILLHGYGADGTDLMPLAEELSSNLPHMAFISPHAPFPCDAGYGRQWFPLDTLLETHIQAGINMARPHLKRFIKAQGEKRDIAMENIFLLGFSQGGILSLTIGLEDMCFGGLIGCSTTFMTPSEKRSCTHTIPVLLTHGSMDSVLPMIPYYEFSLHELRKINNIKLTTLLRPSLGHGIDTSCIQAIAQFLQVHTKSADVNNQNL